jgi:hypothetical protein
MLKRQCDAAVEKFDRYEELLDVSCLQAAMRILKLG